MRGVWSMDSAIKRLRKICKMQKITLIDNAIMQSFYIIYLRERNTIIIAGHAKEKNIMDFILHTFS
jgi:hypothetical protein